MRLTILRHSNLGRKGDGLGTRLKTVIAKIVDAAPIPAKTKRAIKACSGCGRRAARIDQAEATVRRAIGLEAKGETGQDRGNGTG